MLLFFHFLRSNAPDNKCLKQKWRMLFCTRIKLMALVRMQSHASNGEDW